MKKNELAAELEALKLQNNVLKSILRISGMYFRDILLHRGDEYNGGLISLSNDIQKALIQQEDGGNK